MEINRNARTLVLAASFLGLVFDGVVFAQGFVATLFFGWLALYLPAQFPVTVRATGSGLAFNSGRFATAFGVLGLLATKFVSSSAKA